MEVPDVIQTHFFSPQRVETQSWAYGPGWAVNVTSPCIPADLVPCGPSPQLYLIPSVSSGIFPMKVRQSALSLSYAVQITKGEY